jgi:Reverse transcriptase (RNA-dependent DNA polymerase)
MELIGVWVKIGSRWVLSRKIDGKYRARCVAKGFSQNHGNNFQENYAPLIYKSTCIVGD